MKDRLAEMVSISAQHPDTRGRPEDHLGFENYDNLEQQAVVFESEDQMKGIFKEVHLIRKEICLLKSDVKRLRKQNRRFLTSVRRMSSIKRDSNTLGRDIKARGESIYKRMEKLEMLSKELEEKEGSHSVALVRMARAQHFSLTQALHEAMTDYNDAEMIQRENCKTRIQRQAEIMGKEVTGQQIEEMIEVGKLNLFSDNLLTDGRMARSALTEIENHHRELLDLESRIKDIYELFFQMALLVEEQGAMLDNVEANVLTTEDYIAKATEHITMAVKYQRNSLCRRLLCCCSPCCP